MGANASSCDTQRNKLERVVNVCCREDNTELSVERLNVYENERNRYILADQRTHSTSKWKNRQSDFNYHPEMCCGCEMKEAGQRSLAAKDDHGTHDVRLKGNKAPRSSSDKKSSNQKQTECSEDHYKMTAPPPGWTESEMIILKKAVEKAACTGQIKPPGFVAMQVIQVPPPPRYTLTDFDSSYPFLRSSVSPIRLAHANPFTRVAVPGVADWWVERWRRSGGRERSTQEPHRRGERR